MDVSSEHDEGMDFGALVISFGKDDSVALSFDGGCVLRLPLYNHEARAIIETLKPIAESSDQ